MIFKLSILVLVYFDFLLQFLKALASLLHNLSQVYDVIPSRQGYQLLLFELVEWRKGRVDRFQLFRHLVNLLVLIEIMSHKFK